jgi:uncharacterized protein YbaR (Trm112 family)
MPNRRGDCVVCKRRKKGVLSETGALVCAACREKYNVKLARHLEKKLLEGKR